LKTAVAFANAFHRQTDPIIYPTIRTVQIKNKTVIAVRVPPVRTNLIPLNGQAYRRVGRTTQTLNRSEYERLLFERHANGYETLQATGAR
jgi:predicted HTH transcriptional regulator